MENTVNDVQVQPGEELNHNAPNQPQGHAKATPKQVDNDPNTGLPPVADDKRLKDSQAKITEQAELIKELQAKLGAEPEENKEVEQKEAPKELKLDESNPFDMEALGKELVEHGDLSEASRAQIDKSLAASFPDEATRKQIVDNYVNGMKAMAQVGEGQKEALTAELIEHVGGTDAWSTLETWAINNMTIEERTAFNESPDQRAALSDLMIRYQRATGSLPGSANKKRLSGDPQRQAPSVGAYESEAAWRKDMLSEAYNEPRNQAFRDNVLARKKASPWYRG